MHLGLAIWDFVCHKLLQWACEEQIVPLVVRLELGQLHGPLNLLLGLNAWGPNVVVL